MATRPALANISPEGAKRPRGHVITGLLQIARELLQKGEELPALLVASMLEEKLLSLEVQHYGRVLNRLVTTRPALQH